MTRTTKREWWMVAALSGLICGVFGPLLGVLLLVAGSFRNGNPLGPLSDLLLSIAIGWGYAEVAFGIPAFILGCCGGALLKALACRCGSAMGLTMLGMALGAALGSAVPSWVVVYAWKHFGLTAALMPANLRTDAYLLLIGTISGFLCGLLMICLLRSRRLLDLSQRQSPF